MKSKIMKCEKCGTYTLKDVCPECGNKSITPIPPRYSPEDSYGKYRRMMRKEFGFFKTGGKNHARKG